jgi:crotonobetainyl-CoA:carnitine CoA-transferase CaiB-like acyl-CoA transferase
MPLDLVSRLASERSSGDLVAGLYAALGVCAALVHRTWRDGRVQPQQRYDQHTQLSRRKLPRNRRAMNAAIEKPLAGAGSAYWIEKLNAAGVPRDRAITLPEVFADPQTRDQEMVISAERPGHGEVQMLGFPIKFAEAPCRTRRPSPDLGADTDAALHELGYLNENVAALRRKEVV